MRLDADRCGLSRRASSRLDPGLDIVHIEDRRILGEFHSALSQVRLQDSATARDCGLLSHSKLDAHFAQQNPARPQIHLHSQVSREYTPVAGQPKEDGA
jgi:hypothetical protein